jgi:hypothetical protein
MTRGSRVLILAMAALGALARAQGLNPVHWSFSDRNVKTAPGRKLVVHIIAEIEPEWHLYGLKQIEGGPIATTVTVEKDPAFQIAGDIDASPPVSADDPAFGVRVQYYLGRVHFELPVRVLADARPGRTLLKIVARYQMCNDTLCLPPKRVALDLPVEISAADAR